MFAPGAEGGAKAFDDRVRATDYPGPVLPPTRLRRNLRRGRMAIAPGHPATATAGARPAMISQNGHGAPAGGGLTRHRPR